MDPEKRLKKFITSAIVEVKQDIDPLMYFNSGTIMFKTSLNHIEKREYANALYMLLRYISLFVEKVPKHPKYKSVPLSEKKKVRENLNIALQEAERLKKLVLEIFEKQHQEWLTRPVSSRQLCFYHR